jgi:hypothetical protein
MNIRVLVIALASGVFAVTSTARGGDSEELQAVINQFANKEIQGAEITTYPSYPSDGSTFVAQIGYVMPGRETQLPPAGTVLFPVRFVRG